ncbi:LysM peptidoglycan-binding domain-containing protein [Psychrobacter sp. HD31]|uniref:lytic transglycosylase n=1 Tax=Psychrobacter sp. HD31 TaxID=3112003 RepID=UPI003DA41919
MIQHCSQYKNNDKKIASQLVLLTVSVSAIMLSSCSSTGSKKPYSNTNSVVNTNYEQTDYSGSLLDVASINELADLLEAKNMDMVENNQADIMRMGNLWDRLRSGFRLDHSQYNARIEAQKNWFITRQQYLDRLTARASRYLYHTVREAERRHMPTELALLPVIESSYDPSATSNASAAGLWQFIPSTGKMYGLSVTQDYDGRRDVIESTGAAYEFLTALYNRFGSWELALAAYNCGPGCVQRAINRNESRGLPTDFWSLKLPKETMNYVPRFWAVSDIVSNPTNHGVYLPAIANQQHFRTVPVATGVSLYQVSKTIGISSDELQNLNPGLTFGQIVSHAPQRIVIPNSVSVNVDKKLSALGSGAIIKNEYPKETYTALNTTFQNISKNNNIQYNSKPYDKSRLPTNGNELANYAQGALIHNSANNIVVNNNTNQYPTAVSSEPPLTAAEISRINKEVISAKANTSSNTTLEANNIQSSQKTVSVAKSLDKKEEIIASNKVTSESVKQEVIEKSVLPVSKAPKDIKLDEIKTQQDVLEEKGEEKKLSFATKDNKLAKDTKPKGKRSTYTVKRGDTLLNIANRAGVNWRDIAKWNQMSPNATLLAGSTLYLYNAKPIKPLVATKTNDKASQTNKQPQTYVVKPGDTLIGTANELGLRPSQLAKYNNMSVTDDLRIGQKLWLVDNRANTTVSKNVSSSNNTTAQKTIKTQNYQVKSGDGLIALSRRFNTPVKTLAELNGIKITDDLYVGQTIKLPKNAKDSLASKPAEKASKTATNKKPAAKVDVVYYQVKTGDTLTGIADKLNTKSSVIADLNNFTTNYHVQLGQKIKVPANSLPLEPSNKASISKYKVKAGDTLLGVANRLRIKPSLLATANNLSITSDLKIGQVLTIPTTGNTGSNGQRNESKSNTKQKVTDNASSKQVGSSTVIATTYQVKSGDSLTNLAKRFNMSVATLAKANNLSIQSQVQIGQKLKIPATSIKYTVKSGDTLIGLAKKQGVSTKQLAQLNDIPENTELKIGQRIKLPLK